MTFVSKIIKQLKQHVALQPNLTFLRPYEIDFCVCHNV